jgi:hypothetical protein
VSSAQHRAETVVSGVETTKRARSVVRALGDREHRNQAVSEQAHALLNTSTEFGRARLERQLAFYADDAELAKVREVVGSTELVKAPMPEIPKPPAATSK